MSNFIMYTIPYFEDATTFKSSKRLLLVCHTSIRHTVSLVDILNNVLNYENNIQRRNTALTSDRIALDNNSVSFIENHTDYEMYRCEEVNNFILEHKDSIVFVVRVDEEEANIHIVVKFD